MRTFAAATLALALVLAGCGSAQEGSHTAGTASPQPPEPVLTYPAADVRHVIELDGDAAAPSVSLRSTGFEAMPDGAPPQPEPGRFTGTSRVGQTDVRVYRWPFATVLLVPLGAHNAAVADLVKQPDSSGEHAFVRGQARLGLGGRSWLAVALAGGQDASAVRALWWENADGTWTAPTGEQPRVARFPDVGGAVVSWFPRAHRTFLSVGTGARSVAAANSEGDDGQPARDDRPRILTDGPRHLYQVAFLRADAHDVAMETGEKRFAEQTVAVADALVDLYREDLPEEARSHGELPEPAYTDRWGKRHAENAVAAIGILRPEWPPLPGPAPRATATGAHAPR